MAARGTDGSAPVGRIAFKAEREGVDALIELPHPDDDGDEEEDEVPGWRAAFDDKTEHRDREVKDATRVEEEEEEEEEEEVAPDIRMRSQGILLEYRLWSSRISMSLSSITTVDNLQASSVDEVEVEVDADEANEQVLGLPIVLLLVLLKEREEEAAEDCAGFPR